MLVSSTTFVGGRLKVAARCRLGGCCSAAAVPGALTITPVRTSVFCTIEERRTKYAKQVNGKISHVLSIAHNQIAVAACQQTTTTNAAASTACLHYERRGHALPVAAQALALLPAHLFEHSLQQDKREGRAAAQEV